MELLDAKLQLLGKRLASSPEVRVTCFCADERKEGGVYRSVTGRVKKLDILAGTLVLQDGMSIPFADILCLDGEIFRKLP